jgi:hypothetical protein
VPPGSHPAYLINFNTTIVSNSIQSSLFPNLFKLRLTQNVKPSLVWQRANILKAQNHLLWREDTNKKGAPNSRGSFLIIIINQDYFATTILLVNCWLFEVVTFTTYTSDCKSAVDKVILSFGNNSEVVFITN